MRKIYASLFVATFAIVGSMVFVGGAQQAHATCACDPATDVECPAYPTFNRSILLHVGDDSGNVIAGQNVLVQTGASNNLFDCNTNESSATIIVDGSSKRIVLKVLDASKNIIKPGSGWSWVSDVNGTQYGLLSDGTGYKLKTSTGNPNTYYNGNIQFDSSLVGQSVYVRVRYEEMGVSGWVIKAGTKELVTVSASLPTASLSADSLVVPYNGSTLLHASSTNADQGFWANGLTGTFTLPNSSGFNSGSITSSKQFQFRAVNSTTGQNVFSNTVTITPSGPPPSISCSLAASPASGVMPLSTNLTVTASGAAGYDYSFNFGDGLSGGAISNAGSPYTYAHTYASAGTYNAVATVTDHNDSSRTTTCSAAVTVTPPSCPGAKVTLSQSQFGVGGGTLISAPSGWSGGSFSSSNTNVVTIGSVTGYTAPGMGVGAGKSTITGSGWNTNTGATNCSLGGAVATVNGTFTIDPTKTCTKGGTAHFDAYYSNDGHTTQTVTSNASWSSLNGLVATSAGNGDFNCIGTGTATVRATYTEPATGSTLGPANGSLTVNPANCPSGSVSANPTTINIGATTALSAPAGWSNGTFVAGFPSMLTIFGSTGTGKAAGSTNVSGSGWTVGGATGCSLSPVQVTINPAAVNGSCLPQPLTQNTMSYASGATGWDSKPFCDKGTASPLSPAFPSAGGSTSWSCVGSGGGTTASCSASRQAVVCTPNWAPDPSTVCSGTQFTQTDSSNCETPNTRTATGTGPCGGGISAALLVNGSHNLTGANKIVVPYGQGSTNLNITWQASNANGCDASNSGGLQGWIQNLWNNILKAFNSGSAVSTVTQPGTYNFTIQCH